jgi:hypothetical protein
MCTAIEEGTKERRFEKDKTPEYQTRSERHKKYLSEGYRIVSPEKRELDRLFRELYTLIMELYQNFPLFKRIGQEDFRRQFRQLTDVLDLSMIKIAYHEDEPVGFVICLPDYGELPFQPLTVATKLEIFKRKIKSKTYVVL